MSEAPKKIWVEVELDATLHARYTDYMGGSAYVRKDLVNGLVEALEKISALEDTEEDEWDGVERVIPLMASTARAALKTMEEKQCVTQTNC